MAAPAPTVYRSTDGSAPVLSGSGGALVNVLDKCLVAGYGSKPAAGWTKPYTGTNTASFRQGGGNSFYLDVNDNGPGAGTFKEARLFGYEAMTAVATGTGSFPTTAQLAAGIIGRKSATADGTARAWTLIADDRTFYLFIQAGDTAGMWYGLCFGDFYSYLAGTDGYRTMIIGRATENNVASTIESLDRQADISSTLAGHYVPRSYTGLGGSLQVALQGDSAKGGAAGLLGVMGAPNPADGRVWIAPVTINQPSITVRGKMRGFMHWLHTVASFADQDTVTGTGVYTGRTFLLFKTTGNAAAYCIDITGPWDAN